MADLCQIARPWAKTAGQVAKDLGVSPEQGLSLPEVKKRRKKCGPNQLRQARTKSTWLILADQFKSFMTLLLAVAAIMAFVVQEMVEGISIGAVIFINALIGFVTELRAVRSMEALYRLSKVEARVRREGETEKINANQIVPGDMVVVEAGDLVPADLRLVEASKLQADESALTGESVPVSKTVEALTGDIPLAERKNILFKGTAVTRGSGLGVAVATGMNTELGRISDLVEQAEEETTPLEKRLNSLATRLIWVTLLIAAGVAGVGILAERDFFLMIETSIALAVAAVPEGLPIVATIALARGMWRMAQRQALINRLSAVETLGATTVICTDKTGTLTENRMTVTRMVLPDAEIKVNGDDQGEGFFQDGKQLDPHENQALREALLIGVLCNNASFPDKDGRTIGEPMEVALLLAGAKGAIDPEQIKKDRLRIREEAFDPDTKMMATFHQEDKQLRVAVKGAPESVLEACSQIRRRGGEDGELQDRDRWQEANRDLASKGLRVLALATKMVASEEAHPYKDLILLGLVGFVDPPRQEVRQAIHSCQEAGIRVVMVTGDHPETARYVGEAIGLLEKNKNDQVILGSKFKNAEDLSESERSELWQTPIFARVSPEQKLKLISFYQGQQAVVAMTGDGVNDAPALKKADIGIAMGQRGTQVAREAADMVLQDDSFGTIVLAMQQGRVIFKNIRKFVIYLLSCNFGQIMSVSLASIINIPLPILPLQILFLNMVNDVFPALALGMGEGEPDVMKSRPRDPAEPVLRRTHWLGIGAYGLVISGAVLGALLIALFWYRLETKQAVSISFLTLALAQLWHVFNMRDRASNPAINDITRNPFVWGALLLCVSIILAAVYLPFLAKILKVTDPGPQGWALIMIMSLMPLFVGQISKTFVRLGSIVKLKFSEPPGGS